MSRDVALKRIEDLVLSFLTQLRNSLLPPGEKYDVDDETTIPSDQNISESSYCKKITLHLADRRKHRQDGFVSVVLVIFNQTITDDLLEALTGCGRSVIQGNQEGPVQNPLVSAYMLCVSHHEILIAKWRRSSTVQGARHHP